MIFFLLERRCPSVVLLMGKLSLQHPSEALGAAWRVLEGDDSLAWLPEQPCSPLSPAAQGSCLWPPDVPGDLGQSQPLPRRQLRVPTRAGETLSQSLPTESRPLDATVGALNRFEN